MPFAGIADFIVKVEREDGAVFGTIEVCDFCANQSSARLTCCCRSTQS